MAEIPSEVVRLSVPGWATVSLVGQQPQPLNHWMYAAVQSSKF